MCELMPGQKHDGLNTGLKPWSVKGAKQDPIERVRCPAHKGVDIRKIVVLCRCGIVFDAKSLLEVQTSNEDGIQKRLVVTVLVELLEKKLCGGKY